MKNFTWPLVAALLICAAPAAVRAEEEAPFPFEMAPEGNILDEPEKAVAPPRLESLLSLEMRVALIRAASSATLAGEGNLLITSAESGARLNTGDLQTITVQRSPHGIRINTLVFPIRSIRVESPDGIIGINGKRYRGYIVLWDNGKGTFDVVNHVMLEDYLRSVVAAEMPKSWPVEALKAQAVAARTYALFRRQEMNENYFDLETTVMDQVYGGVANEDPRTDKAVSGTAGMILMYKNQVARTFFHANCGDRTEDGVEVFQKVSVPYLKSVPCEYGKKSPYYTWQIGVRMNEIEAALARAGLHRGKIASLATQSRTKTGRVKTLALHNGRNVTMVDAVAFRLALGPARLKSTRFTIQKQGTMVTFKGIGYGHGVGLCQWGAKGMADAGRRFGDILGKYYPGATVAVNVLASVPE
ncbi:MAG: SpoIID/LytB domain-containing protein [Nitrospinae bacterium]|nr:SpoIID/LytB domain-containing protein [Nitrospinota bacterium]